jgi:hypothetical protein
MNKSRHRIYTVLKEPLLPWKQSPYQDTQNPWSDALDYSCNWAEGTKTLDAAEAAIITRVNLPEGGLKYNKDAGACHYTACASGDIYSTDTIVDSFNCTAYIDRLGGGWGNGIYVNCSDCACIVATFSNILGCELWESKMGFTFFLNPIISIGGLG